MRNEDAPRRRSRHPKAFIAGGVVAVAVVASVAIGTHVAAGSAAGTAAPAGAVSKQLAPGQARAIQDPQAAAAPASTAKVTATRVQIPAIGVDTKLIALDLKPGTDQLKAPLDFDVAGWYVDGTVPGDVGPAVIDGHVDSPTKPGVFLHLARLKRGDQIVVTLSNAQVKTFVVTKTMAAPKANFPTQAVYGPTPTAQLRVITCDGIFDKSTGHYLDNLVVFADLVA